MRHFTGWTTGTCESNWLDVHYLRTGGDKPPVILLHGLMLNGACWIPLARTLEEDYLAEIQVRHNRRHREIIELFAQARFQTSIHAFEVLTPPNHDYVQLINTLDVPSLLIVGDVGFSSLP